MARTDELYVLKSSLDLPLPRPKVFEFFADAGNLPRITPPWLGFRIKSPQPIAMEAGTLIDYTIRWLGLPIRWRTRIEVYEPPAQFVDVQLRGPYRVWRHTHTFEPTPTGTRIRDQVEYALPLGWLGRVAHRMAVRRQLEEIFGYRRERIEAILVKPAEAGPRA